MLAFYHPNANVLQGGGMRKRFTRIVGLGICHVASVIVSGAAGKEIFLWDLDGVVLTRTNMVGVALSYPRKKELWRQLSYPLLRDALTVLFGRRVFGFKGATEQYVRLANQYEVPLLEEFVLSVANAKKVIPGTVEIMRQLHEAGYPQYIGTNMGKTVFEHLVQKKEFSFLGEWFDVSASQFVTLEGLQHGIFKPKKLFFEEFLLRNDLHADRVIFIDDRLENVKSARDVGLRAVKFTGPRALVRRLKKMGVATNKMVSISRLPGK